jgi:hypothetical protein
MASQHKGVVKVTTLTEANAQWRSRPADQRYNTVAALHAAASKQRAEHSTGIMPVRNLVIVPDGSGDLRLTKQGGSTSRAMTNWSFGQLCRTIGAPADYVANKLSAETAAQCLNENISDADYDRKAVMLFQGNGEKWLRALTSEIYARVWNCDLTKRLLELEAAGWNAAPAAFDGSRGLYLSDRDMFAFMVDNNRRIFERDPNGGLSRGFFLTNSEVGASKVRLKTFLYAFVCGNHLVWEAQDVKEVAFRHVGEKSGDNRGKYDTDKLYSKIAAFMVEMTAWANSSADSTERMITSYRATEFRGTKDEMLDTLFGALKAEISQKQIVRAYDAAEKHVDWYGSPKSQWGIMNGITEIARDNPYQDDRQKLERAASLVPTIRFN